MMNCTLLTAAAALLIMGSGAHAKTTAVVDGMNAAEMEAIKTEAVRQEHADETGRDEGATGASKDLDYGETANDRDEDAQSPKRLERTRTRTSTTYLGLKPGRNTPGRAYTDTPAARAFGVTRPSFGGRSSSTFGK